MKLYCDVFSRTRCKDSGFQGTEKGIPRIFPDMVFFVDLCQRETCSMQHNNKVWFEILVSILLWSEKFVPCSFLLF